MLLSTAGAIDPLGLKTSDYHRVRCRAIIRSNDLLKMYETVSDVSGFENSRWAIWDSLTFPPRDTYYAIFMCMGWGGILFRSPPTEITKKTTMRTQNEINLNHSSYSMLSATQKLIELYNIIMCHLHSTRLGWCLGVECGDWRCQCAIITDWWICL